MCVCGSMPPGITSSPLADTMRSSAAGRALALPSTTFGAGASREPVGAASPRRFCPRTRARRRGTCDRRSQRCLRRLRRSRSAPPAAVRTAPHEQGTIGAHSTGIVKGRGGGKAPRGGGHTAQRPEDAKRAEHGVVCQRHRTRVPLQTHARYLLFAREVFEKLARLSLLPCFSLPCSLGFGCARVLCTGGAQWMLRTTWSMALARCLTFLVLTPAMEMRPFSSRYTCQSLIMARHWGTAHEATGQSRLWPPPRMRAAKLTREAGVGEHANLGRDVRPVAGSLERAELVDQQLAAGLNALAHAAHLCTATHKHGQAVRARALRGSGSAHRRPSQRRERGSSARWRRS